MLRLFLMILVSSPLLMAQDPLYSWTLNPDFVKNGQLIPTKGNLKLTADKVTFSKELPKAYLSVKAPLSVLAAKDKFPSKALSVAAWVKVDETPKWSGILTLTQDNGDYERGFFFGTKGNKFSFSTAGVKKKSHSYITASTPIAPGFWYYVVGTYDGHTQKLYVDGKLSQSYKSRGGDIAYPEVQLPTIGASKDDDSLYPFSGQINEISVYDTALTEEFIQKKFLDQKVLYPGVDGTLQNDGQWPTYQGNNQRQAASPTELPFPLKQQWLYKARHQPAPAWPAPAKKDYWHNKDPKARVTFDRVYHLVGQDDLLYFASSADHKIYCLDNRTGKEIWSFFTEGPVRLAPTLANGKVFTGSDDGYVYCNHALTGKLIWKKRLAKEDARLPGNEHIISQWPVRTGVLIEDDIAHFCAGLFPSQGVFRGAADTNTGKILANIALSSSAQGYLKETSGQIEFTQGRLPAKKFLLTLKRNFKDITQEVLLLPRDYSSAFIKAGNVHIGGGDGKIIAIDGTKNKVLWRAKVTGQVDSLAVINGRLYASTSAGYIYCFGGKAGDPPVTTSQKLKTPYISADDKGKNEAIFTGILNKRKQLHKGYLLVSGLNSKDIYSLCQLSDYQIIAVEKDATTIDEMRREIDSYGLYGTRVSIHHQTQEVLPYIDGIFNLILDPQDKLSKSEKSRILQPFTGLAFSGQKYLDQISGVIPAGIGSWTNMYGNAANTNCSSETNIGTKVDLQWFGRPGPRKMIDRHHRTVAPLSHNGRLFIPGENIIICSDAWNGTILWELEVPESMRIMAQKDCSYISVDEKYLYIAAADKCLLVDVRNGKISNQLLIKTAGSEWGYLGLTDKLIIGSIATKGTIRRSQNRLNTQTLTHKDYVPVITSSELFATKKTDNTASWKYQAKGGIPHMSICLYEDKVFFVESHNKETLKGQQTLEKLLSKGSSIVCLDIHTGKQIWRREYDIKGLRHTIHLAAAKGTLILSGSKNINETKPGVHSRKNGELRYQVFTMDTKNGELFWEKEMNPTLKAGGTHGEADRRPVIIGNKLILEPFCYDLRSGKDNKEFTYSINRRRGCGQMTASNKALFFRNATAGGFDLQTNKIERVTTTTRPGCWLNMIPASGLLLIPEASSGCVCNYAIQTSLAFRPKK